MTLQEVLGAIKIYGNQLVKITLTNGTVVKGVLNSAYSGHPKDPRGYFEDYFYLFRIDKSPNVTEKYDCKDVVSIEGALLKS